MVYGIDPNNRGLYTSLNNFGMGQGGNWGMQPGASGMGVVDAMEPVLAPLRNAGVSTQGLTSMVPQIESFGSRPVARPQSVLDAAAAVDVNSPEGAGGGIWGGIKSTFGNGKGGLNIDNITSVLDSVGSIYGAIKGYGLAKDTLKLQKRQFETNLANQTKSYNTALEGRARGRASYDGISDAQIEEYINSNRL